jgi:hypothetical protein|tara:strand:- start:558 stop:1634 length:1077 start_codon:yes stop_codon:yes gene_type:complete
MGTRKEALGKTTSALKELVSTLVGWPWIKRQPKQLNMFDREYAEYVRTNEQRFSAWRQVMNDVSKKVAHAQDGIAEVRELVKELQVSDKFGRVAASSTDKKVEALEAQLASLRTNVKEKPTSVEDHTEKAREARATSPKNEPSHEGMRVTPVGERPTHHLLWAVQDSTKDEIVEYANWARDAGEFTPNVATADSPMLGWSNGKRSRMFRHMIDLRLIRVTDRGGYGGPKKAIFIGTLKKWKYTVVSIEKLSSRLFKQGIGKWSEPDREEAPVRPAEDPSLEELEQQAYESDDPDLAEELYDRAVELDNQANGVVTVLEEYKDEGAEQKPYHVGATKTDLGDDWSAKYRDDRRGNREHS